MHLLSWDQVWGSILHSELLPRHTEGKSRAVEHLGAGWWWHEDVCIVQCSSCSVVAATCMLDMHSRNDTDHACMYTAETCLQTLDEVLLSCLDNFVVFARYVMLLAKPLGGRSIR